MVPGLLVVVLVEKKRMQFWELQPRRVLGY
jgi:hypothetical protein